MDRIAKKDLVTSLAQTFESMNLVVVAQHDGLTVSELETLRGEMRGEGAQVKIVKNRLAKIAVQGTPFAGLDPILEGSTLLAFSESPVAAAKVAARFADSNPKLKLVGGVLSGHVLDARGVNQLATLPSLDVLRGKLIGVIMAPATRIASVLQAPAGQLARVVAARSRS